jgi:hypothetical protein
MFTFVPTPLPVVGLQQPQPSQLRPLTLPPQRLSQKSTPSPWLSCSYALSRPRQTYSLDPPTLGIMLSGLHILEPPLGPCVTLQPQRQLLSAPRLIVKLWPSTQSVTVHCIVIQPTAVHDLSTAHLTTHPLALLTQLLVAFVLPPPTRPPAALSSWHARTPFSLPLPLLS